MPVKMSKVESAIRLALAHTAAFNAHDADAIARLMSDDCTLETADPAPDGRSLTGREAVAAYYRDQFQAVPTLKMETEDISGLGHQCIRRSRLTWQDPDGRPHHRRAVDIFKERDGVIVAQAGYVKG